MFISAKQELYLMENVPELWKEWVKSYGHAKGFQELASRSKRKKKRKYSPPKRLRGSRRRKR